ncbi:MAG: hypothetical protein ACRC62_04180 [Microcoleus sp.]
MGWKVRSDKLKSVNERVTQKGGRTQVNWIVAKYKIAKALTSRGPIFEGKLDLTDFEYLNQQGIYTFNPKYLLSDVMPKLKSQKFSLDEIRDWVMSEYKYTLQNFLDYYLKIDGYSSRTWDKFFNDRTDIEYDVFQEVCNFLGFSCNEIGTYKTEKPDSKNLETLLWQLNHQNQIAEFQNLVQSSSNLVCFRLRAFSNQDIRIYWLLKALLQPAEDSIEQAEIDFNSLTHSNSQKRLNDIIRKLNLSNQKKLIKKQDYDEIAKAICEKMWKGKKTIVLLFHTQELVQFKESEKLLKTLYRSLQAALQDPELKIQKQQKILMVSIDSQASSPNESEAYDPSDDSDDRDIAIAQLEDLISQFTEDDIIEWISCESVNTSIWQMTNRDLNNISEFIWKESKEGRSEDLLESVYKLCNLDWKKYRDLWYKI